MGESEARTIARATLQGLLIQSLCVEKHRPLARRIAWAAPPELQFEIQGSSCLCLRQGAADGVGSLGGCCLKPDLGRLTGWSF